MRRLAALARSVPLEPSTLGLLLRASALTVFGIVFESSLAAIEARVPREIYHEPDFTWALLERRPAFLLVALVALLLGGWSITPGGRRQLAWPAHDTIGGMRWVVFGVMVTLAWPYALHPYNHYYDQAHLWDRGLVLLFMFLSLRSPLWIPFFVLQVVISRVQTYHPVSLRTPISDELPLRVLGVVTGFGLWNLLAAGLRSLRERRPGWIRAPAAPTGTPALVFSILCLIGSYYLYAAIGKLELGVRPLDWVMQSHQENLFIGAYLNGWNAWLSEGRALELAGGIRLLSVPIAAGSLTIELAMLLVLARRWLTVPLLLAAIAMHLGIVAVTGVFFWTWALVDVCLVAWLIRRRNSEALGRLYSPGNAVVSVLLIASLAVVFGQNRFAWWNTKWNTSLELDALDREGNLYRIDYADFSPYLLLSFWKPYGPSIPGWYGGTPSQRVMQRLESIDPATLKASNDARWAASGGPAREPTLDEFMQRFFQNRNRNLERGIPWLPPPPTLRMRNPRGGIPYRGQAPVEKVRVRYVEKHYTGSALYPLRDEIVHTIPIPPLEAGADPRGAAEPGDDPAEAAR